MGAYEIEQMQDERDIHQAISSVLGKIDAKIKRVKGYVEDDENILIKLTWAEIHALRQFGRKHFND